MGRGSAPAGGARRSKRPAPRRGRVAGKGAAHYARAVSLTALALVGASILGVAWILVVYPGRAASGRGHDVTVSIDPSRGLDQNVTALAAASVVESPTLFAIYARLLGADDHLRAHDVVLTDDMTPREVLMRIADGFGAAQLEIVVPEGFDRFDVAARLDRWGVCTGEAFLGATEDRALLDDLEISGPTAEGYLYPDTYALREGMDPADVVRRFVSNYRRRTDPIFEEHRAGMEELTRTLGWTPHEVLVLASIVEKEAVVREEQAVIAGVFLNRLRDPEFLPRQRLQADPTVSYGCLEERELAPSCASFDGRTITRAMLEDSANRYNTYRHGGLPPGPICSPGAPALRAVLAWERHDYLYFVARGRGRHTFSRTLDEHNRGVTALRDREAARERDSGE